MSYLVTEEYLMKKGNVQCFSPPVEYERSGDLSTLRQENIDLRQENIDLRQDLYDKKI